MPTTVKTDDGRTLVFPDGMSKDDMTAAMEKLPPLKSVASQAADRLAANATMGADGRFTPSPTGADIQNEPDTRSTRDRFVEGAAMMSPGNIAVGQGKSALGMLYHIGRGAKRMVGMTPDSDPDFEAALEPQNAGETVGKLSGDAAAFLAGDAAASTALKAAPLLGKLATVAPRLAKFAGFATGVAKNAAVGYGVTRIQGGDEDAARINAAIGGGLPVLLEGVGGALKSFGNKQIMSILRPSVAAARDSGAAPEEAQWLAETLNKFGLSKSSVKGTLEAVHNKIVDLAGALRATTGDVNAGAVELAPAEGLATRRLSSLLDDQKWSGNANGARDALRNHESAIREAIDTGRAVPSEVLADYPDLANRARMASIPGPKIDLEAQLKAVEDRLMTRTAKVNIGAEELPGVMAQIKEYRDFIADLPGGPVTLVDEAQTFKRNVGLHGAWEYGRSAAERGAKKVANALYDQVKTAIDMATKDAPVAVRTINRQLSELMPVEQAIIKRLPVIARRDPVSFKDLVLLATGHPGYAAAHVISKTMAGANALYSTGRAISAAAKPGTAAIQALRKGGAPSTTNPVTEGNAQTRQNQTGRTGSVPPKGIAHDFAGNAIGPAPNELRNYRAGWGPIGSDAHATTIAPTAQPTRDYNEGSGRSAKVPANVPVSAPQPQPMRQQARASIVPLDDEAHGSEVTPTQRPVSGQSSSPQRASGERLDLKSAVRFFISKGWTPEQATGIAANLHYESGFNHKLSGDGGLAYGLAQWHPDRQREFAALFGHDIRQSTPQEQLEFVHYELTDGAEVSAGHALATTDSARAAAETVSRMYERPAGGDASARVRGALADRMVTR